MRIEVWADVADGWAYIAKRRLGTALELWDGEPLTVVWRPFLSDPTAPNPAVTVVDVDEQFGIGRVAAAEGLGPRWGAAWRGDVREAHRLVWLAYDQGGPELQERVVEALLHARFVEALDLTDREVLDRIAEAAGLPGDVLDGEAGRAETREEMLRGKALGVVRSPTLVVGERLLRGAQTPEEIVEFLRDSNDHVPVPDEVRRLRYAEALLERKDPLGALEMLKPLLEDFGQDPNVRMLAARAYFASAQLHRAEAVLLELVERDPGDFYARHMLGRTLQRMGRNEEAAPHLALTAEMF